MFIKLANVNLISFDFKLHGHMIWAWIRVLCVECSENCILN